MEVVVDAGLCCAQLFACATKGFGKVRACTLDHWGVMRGAEWQIELPAKVNQLKHGAVDLLDVVIAAGGRGFHVADAGGAGTAGAEHDEARRPGDAAGEEIADKGCTADDGADAAGGGADAAEDGVAFGFAKALAPLSEVAAAFVQANKNGLEAIGLMVVQVLGPGDDVGVKVNDAGDEER